MDEVQLRDYQIVDLAFYISHPRCGNFSDPGTGKTPSVCVYFYWLWTEKKSRSFWVMPKSLLEKNRKELLLFSDFSEDDVVVIDGTPKQRAKLIAKDAKVFLMGFDCFARNWRQFVKVHPDVNALIGDEWHLGFKSDGSARTKSLYDFMDRTTYFVAMTGTIIDGRLDTAYPFIQLVAPDSYSGGWYGFKMAHAIENDYGQIVAWRNPERVGAIFGKHAIRHTFEEVYGPEGKVIVHEACDMEPRQREAYDEFEETALLELEDSWLDGTLPGPNQIRARQIMEHPQEFGPPLDTIKRTGKEERLQIHLEDHKRTQKPLVIFAAFTAQHNRVAAMCRDMGFRTEIINGTVTMKRRAEIDEKFQDGEIDIVVASAATAGVGFNWGHVDHIIFMSLDYMDSSFIQAYRRAIRGKREKPLLITVMEYENSIDQKIFAIVEKKSVMAHAVDNTRQKIKLRGESPKTKTQKPVETEIAGFRMDDFISRN